MRFSTLTLFGFVAACAVMIGYVALPSDFQQLITVAIFVAAGCASSLYLAFAREPKHTQLAALVMAAVVLLMALVLLLRWLFP
jgi:hypothetical protein